MYKNLLLSKFAFLNINYFYNLFLKKNFAADYLSTKVSNDLICVENNYITNDLDKDLYLKITDKFFFAYEIFNKLNEKK
jgi:hypothetical protein